MHVSDYIETISGITYTIPETELLRHDPDCWICETRAGLLRCCGCGAFAVVTDCWHTIHPIEISCGRIVDGEVADLDELYCEDCANTE